MEESCKSLEVALERCEDLCEEQRMQREKNNHILQLASYKKRRTEELDKVKGERIRLHFTVTQLHETLAFYCRPVTRDTAVKNANNQKGRKGVRFYS